MMRLSDFKLPNIDKIQNKTQKDQALSQITKDYNDLIRYLKHNENTLKETKSVATRDFTKTHIPEIHDLIKQYENAYKNLQNKTQYYTPHEPQTTITPTKI